MSFSIITNYPQGEVVKYKLYNNPIIDAIKRNDYFNSVLPVINWGLNVTNPSGLQIQVSPGAAEGLPVAFPNIDGTDLSTLTMPTRVSLDQPATISVPPNFSGWVVLNVNITPSPSTTSFSYQIQAEDGNGNIGPQLVTTLLPKQAYSTYPYTQIVLGYVQTNANSVTLIEMENPPTMPYGNLSFRMEKSLATKPDSYIYPAVTTNSNGICWTLPGGLKIQIMNIQFPITNISTTNQYVYFPTPFSNLEYFLAVTPDRKSAPDGDAAIVTSLYTDRTLTSSYIELDVNVSTGTGFSNWSVQARILAIGM